MRIEQRGLVYDSSGREASERVAFFTSLCLLRDGGVLCAFQVGSSKHGPDSTVRFCRSQDGGVTWSEVPYRFPTDLEDTPGSLAAPEMVEVAPGGLLLFATWFDRSDPARPLYDPQTEGILRSRQLAAVSSDNGNSWSPWQPIPTPGLTGCATTGPVLKWSDGTIAYAFESFKEFDDPRPAQHGAWLVVSRDGGRSFEPPRLVARDPTGQVYYWDQRLCAWEIPGEFFGLFWTHDRMAKRDRNVHLLRGSIHAHDRGQDLPQETTIPGQIAAPLQLQDGRLLAFVVDRGAPGTLKLWQSFDSGRTWPEQDARVIHTHDDRAVSSSYKDHIEFSQYWEDMGKWSFGHPAIRQLDREHVLLAFYAGTPEEMSIHWARVNVC